MKRFGVLAVALLLVGQPAAGAERTMTVKAQTRIVDGDREWHEERGYTYSFQIEAYLDRGGRMEERSRDRLPFIEAVPGEEYRVRIYNPLPVRVAANLSIDGLNSLTGKPGTPEGGRKWVIDPESWVDISGWQVSERTARRFVFTSKRQSYATWRSNSWGKDLSVNCGVIGVAYFWSQRELDQYFEDNPVVIRRAKRYDAPEMSRDMAPGARMGPATRSEAQPSEEQRAGTGMGSRQSNPVHEVRFDYDRGMYRTRDAVVISYDFPEERHRPQPFQDRGFAPESGENGEQRGERLYPMVVFDNGNIARVYNHPRRETWFTLSETTRIAKIVNYHWNHGRGGRPGSIGLERRDGEAYGPWSARGSAGQGGVPNAYWTVYPNVTIPPGSYRVIDSNPGTWSFNDESGGMGISRIEGE